MVLFPQPYACQEVLTSTSLLNVIDVLIIFEQVANTISPLPDFSGCGTTMGCFAYPSGCGGNGCRYIVTYQYNSTAQTFDFALKGEDYDYISFGISSDEQMVNFKVQRK